MADSKKYDGSQWEHSLRKLTTATEAVENPLYADGTAITAYTLKGNEEHTGTPTPSNPVEVNGVGDKTANLFDEQYDNLGTTIRYKPIYVGDGTYTLSTSMPTHTVEGSVGYFTNLFFLSGNVSTGASTNNNGVWLNHSVTQNATDGYITIAYRIEINNPSDYETMLNSGSTAKPYEPNGYKIPISSGGVTTNIYLGSTQTVRQIKKLVLTGNESLTMIAVSQGNLFRVQTPQQRIQAQFYGYGLCSHYIPVSVADRTTGTISGGNSTNVQDRIDIIDDFSSETAFKAYLAAQYAAGTPVTVWYVLATEETGIVNEPLMKIGTYADTLSNATAIPTTEGANTITVDTTVQPSEFTATWTGWHDASVKEYDGSDWQ